MMDWLSKLSRNIRVLHVALASVVLATVAACGGSGGGFDNSGSGGSGSGGGNTTPITITLSLVSAATGQPTSTITSSNPGRVIATVDGISSPVIVTFTTDVAQIPIPTAITDANNQATVDILAGSQLGAGTVIASLDSGESAQLVYAVGASNLRMGSGNPFQEGVAEVGLSNISAGGTTTVSVTIVDDTGAPFTDPVQVNFTSACASANPPTATISSPITTVNGVASSTYLAQGCVGDDPITVTANAGGINLSATASVNVAQADVGSIEFVSATPEQIAIVGAGSANRPESSTVVFRVRDTNGNPVNGQDVNFSLNTTVGGISLDPVSATTDANGLVQTVINSGTVATTVRVTADTLAADGSQIATQSSNLTISTGIPDQDSFSLSAEVVNAEGWSVDGTQVVVTARLADGFNNPVPDGTSVFFTTEGGSIEPTCLTVNGSCSVTWTSQNPRPEGKELLLEGRTPYPTSNRASEGGMGQKYGGRATITATAIGEESFPDLNGNGRFDASEVDAFRGTDVSGQPYDLKEAFVDHNEDGFFNPGESDPAEEEGGDLETFMDFNSNGVFDQGDGLYNGVLCSIPAHAGCSTDVQSVNVRASIVIVMSDSTAFFTIEETKDSTSNANASDTDNTLELDGESTGRVTVTIADFHNQQMPAGTTVKFTATKGSVQGTSTFTWPSSNFNGGATFSVLVKGEQQPGNGALNIEVTTPKGTISTNSIVDIIVN